MQLKAESDNVALCLGDVAYFSGVIEHLVNTDGICLISHRIMDLARMALGLEKRGQKSRIEDKLQQKQYS